MDKYQKFVSILPKFFDKNIDESSFNNVILGLLNEVFSLDFYCIYFINSDALTLKYFHNIALPSECKIDNFSSLFKDKNILVSDLCLDKFPFAKFVIGSVESFDDSDRKIFSAVSSVVGSIIQDIEINSILKMQVEALQDSMDEVNSAYACLKSRNKKIVAADKVKNEFLANISHQLRSPLNSIIGFSDMLENKIAGELNEHQLEYVKDIKIAGIKLLEMINEILDISKLEAKSMKLFYKTFYLRDNFLEVLNILKPLYLEKNIEVNIDIPERACISADYSKLQQVFFNLISNAIKFTPEGGKICISAVEKKSKVLISVKDTGIGIDKKNHKKIFKKFEQFASSSSPSTGLGLTIVNEIVKLHRGKITVKSEAGKGAEFDITLPLC